MYIADSNHNFDPPGIMAVDLEKLESLNYDVATADLPFAKDIMSYTILDEPEKWYKYSAVKIKGERYFVGTEDGMMGILSNGNLFGLGSCPNCSGGVKDVCYCDATDTVYGIIGSSHDIGIVFSYNDTNGLKFLGRMSYTAADGLCASCELECISVSNDGKFIAVGSKDRLGVLFVLEL